jgi:hypothetical protein
LQARRDLERGELVVADAAEVVVIVGADPEVERPIAPRCAQMRAGRRARSACTSIGAVRLRMDRRMAEGAALLVDGRRPRRSHNSPHIG